MRIWRKRKAKPRPTWKRSAPELTATREKVNAQLKATYEAQVKHIKTQIAEMQAWAKTTDEKIRAKINADLEALRQQAADVEQHIQKLHAEHVATWNEDKAKVERAMADLKAGRDKANADLKAGREKAKTDSRRLPDSLRRDCTENRLQERYFRRDAIGVPPDKLQFYGGAAC